MSITTAQEKLRQQLEKASNKYLAKPVLEYMITRVGESEALANDVDQEHKTWQRCEKYIMDEAKKALNSRSGALPKEQVFEWAEDYFHLDDKAQVEKEKEKEAKKKEQLPSQKAGTYKKKTETKSPKSDEKRPENTENGQNATENAENLTAEVTEMKKPEPKKEKGAMDGQMDIMSMFGFGG